MTAIQYMGYGDIGYRNWINQAELIRDVQNNFYEELVEGTPFIKVKEIFIPRRCNFQTIFQKSKRATIGKPDLIRVVDSLPFLEEM